MLVVDQGNIRQGRGNASVRAASQLLDTLTSGDRVALAVIPGGRYVPFTNHFAMVKEILSRVTGNAEQWSGPVMLSMTEAFALQRGDRTGLRDIQERECGFGLNADQAQACLTTILDEAQQRVQTVWQQTNSSLTAIRQLLVQLRTTSGPKTLILMSEGLILGRELVDVTWVGSLAAEAQVTMYAIHLDDPHVDATAMRGNVQPGADRALQLEGLTLVAGLARGAVFSAMAGTQEIYARLGRELSAFYLITFEPDESERDGRPHAISLDVKRKGVEVRTRRQFTAIPVATARRADEEVLGDTLRDPRLETDIRMRLSTYSLLDPDSGNVRVLVSAGLGRAEDLAGVRAVAYVVTTEDGSRQLSSRVDQLPPREGDEQRYYTTFIVPPGTYRLKVAGVDADGRRGSVERLVNAALVTAGTFRVGDLMIGEPGDGDGLSLTPAIEPVLTGEAIAGYLEVRSDDTERLRATSVALELARDANTPALAAVPLDLAATRTEDRRIAQGQVPLTTLPPGDYVARAVVSVGGRPVSRVLRSFSYVPRAEVRRLGLVGDMRSTGLTFQRSQVLEPSVVGYFLDRLEQPSDASHEQPGTARSVSAATSAALVSARAGRFDDLATVPAAADDAPSAFLRGLGLYAKGDLESAARAFRDALRANPDLSGATFYLGACFAAGGRDKQAVGAWQTTLATEEGAPFVYALVTDAYTRLKDWPAAVELAEEAVATWPDDGAAQLRLARSLALAGRRADALAVIDRQHAARQGAADLFLLGMKVLYDAAADRRPIASPAEDRRRFEGYLRSYKAVGGAEVAVAERWLELIGK
jgi:VWFA-related protein